MSDATRPIRDYEPFLAAMRTVQNPLWGILIALLGANVAINASFFCVRMIGGSPLERQTAPFIRKVIENLQASPILNVALLRLFFWTAPGLNYVLALSPIKALEHFLGTLLGTAIPVAVTVYLTDWLMLKMFP